MIAAPVQVQVVADSRNGCRPQYHAFARVDGRMVASANCCYFDRVAFSRAYLAALLVAPNVVGVRS